MRLHNKISGIGFKPENPKEQKLEPNEVLSKDNDPRVKKLKLALENLSVHKPKNANHSLKYIKIFN